MLVQTAQTLLPSPIYLHPDHDCCDSCSLSQCTNPSAYITHLPDNEKFLETSQPKGFIAMLFDPFFSSYVVKVLPSLTDGGSRQKSALPVRESSFHVLII